MLKIRMQRTGRINDASFRIIVVEHTESAKTGSFVERVGTYNPRTKERNLVVDRIKYWLSVGAQASPTVHNMLITAGVTTGKKKNVLPKKSPPKKDEPAQAAAEAVAPEAQARPEQEAKADESPKGDVKAEEPATA